MVAQTSTPRKPPRSLFMSWIALTEKDTANATLEKRFWDPSDQFRANSGPMLGFFFQGFAQVQLIAKCAQLDQSAKQIPTLKRPKQNLRRTCDLPLPRLLSGQVELKTEAA
jgi:hypothetical protein